MRTSRWVGLIVVAFTGVVVAQVPITKDPRHRLVFENAQFRILDVNIPVGETSLDHLHENDIATVSMSPGADTRIQLSGQPWGPVRPSRPIGDATVAEYTGKAQSHRVENVGKIAYQLFAVENLNKGNRAAAAGVTAPATTQKSEGRAFRIYEVQLSSTRTQTSHTHAVPTIAVLLGGKVMSDGPDAQAKANAPAPVGLRQLDQPGQWLLVPSGDTHHLVRLSTTDVRLVEIEVR